MKAENFSLDEYKPSTDDVSEYLSREDTPADHKMSPSDSAIERRQKAKREKGSDTSVSVDKDPSDQTHHMTEITDPEGRESVTQRVNKRKTGETVTPSAQELADPRDSDNPEHW